MNKDHEHSKNGTHLSDSNQQYASLSDSSDDFLDALQFEAQQVPGLEYEHNDRPKGDIDSDLYDILARDDSTDSSSDDNNSLIDLLCNLTIKTNKMALTVLDEDGPLDDLPKFPFNDLPPDTVTATVTDVTSYKFYAFNTQNITPYSYKFEHLNLLTNHLEIPIFLLLLKVCANSSLTLLPKFTQELTALTRF